MNKVTDHLANERTYLAWLRTGIATIGLGFVVARFGLLIRELTGISSSTTAYHISAIVGTALCAGGALLVLMAFTRFSRNQERIEKGVYEPTKGVELAISLTLFVIALILIGYLLLTS